MAKSNNWNRINQNARMRDKGTEDIAGGLPSAFTRKPRPRMPTKQEQREEAARLFEVYRTKMTTVSAASSAAC
jgi:hypothetical protein